MGGGASVPMVVQVQDAILSSAEGESRFSLDCAAEQEIESRAVSIATHLMPVFFIANVHVEAADTIAVQNTWSLMVEDNCTNYVDCRTAGKTDQPSALIWFYTEFYGRLFDVHPSVKPLFKTTIAGQGRKLVSMISFLILLMDTDVESLHTQLKALARMHCAIGVLSNQYAMMMDTLLWTLQYCLGKEVFMPVRISWLKCLSRVLQVLVPVHVVEEIRLKKSDRFK